ncbi:hypothetical protein OUZ56_011097 [Daphnia magna]|uniref:Uncharacterized protein n=1 Tax=Daphnia magna TaxID=35525 RepID=A0ABQ9YZ90_9CRUS|nr:hypothetical protein OUZ56_011097 [Daphnia magna]
MKRFIGTEKEAAISFRRSWKSAEGTGSHTCLKTLVRPLSYCISDDLGTIKRLNYSRGDLQPNCTCVCCAVLKHVPAKVGDKP